ncbi:MAG: hypothetical protein AB7E85_09325 [Pseudobdellovibrionaceae bacterium]
MFTTRLFTSPANIDVYRAVSRRLVAERTLQSHHFAAGGVYTDLPFDIGHQVSMEQLAQYIPADLRPIEKWAMTPEGEATFNHLVDASIAYFQQYGHMVAPAHDLRHMLVKDMAEALRFAEEGQVTGYKRFFLIASLWHDMGRLLEAHFDEAGLEPAIKVPHAVLSFGLLRDFLAAETPELPKALREQLLYAVQVHSGRNGECFIARAVQRADRFQLLGAEGFLRAVAYALLQIEGDREDYEFLNALLAQKGASSPEGKLAALAIEHGELANPRSLPARNAEANKGEGRSASPQTDPALKL